MLARIRDALTEAGERSLDPDSPTSVGERCRRLIDSALRAGIAHVTYPGGHTPPYPEAMRLGYRRVSLGAWAPRARCSGWSPAASSSG